MAFNLSGKLSLDARDFTKGANQAADALEDVSDKLEEVADDAADAGSDAGQGFTKNLDSALVKGAGMLGGAALIGVALNEAMNIEQGVDRVEGQFALTAEQADRYGQLGGELYANAWGDSVEQTTAAIAEVDRTLGQTAELSAVESAKIAEGAFAIADAFGKDVNEVIRSTGQLLLNGLAPDAETALDVMTVAFQQGGDRAGDLLDTIDEYSQHWAAFGLSAEDALGIMVTGIQNGQRDTDKIADTIKELGLRTKEPIAEVTDAFERLGLNADETRDAIARGGPAARDAFGQIISGLSKVEDPLERNRLGVALMGTAFEDMGPTAVDILASVNDGLGEVGGAAEKLADTITDNAAASFESFKRQAMQDLAELAGVAIDFGMTLDSALQGDLAGAQAKGGSFVDSFSGAIEKYDLLTLGAKRYSDAVIDVLTKQEHANGVIGDLAEPVELVRGEVTLLTQTWEKAGERMDDLRRSTETSIGTYDDATESMDAQRRAADDLAADLRDAKDATYELRDAQRAMTDKNLAAEKALYDVIAAQEELNEVTDDGETAVNEKRLAEIDAIETAFRAVDALTEQEIAQRRANGEVLTAQDEQDVYNRKLGQVAGQLKGPMHDALQAHIYDILRIPNAKSTKITADTSGAIRTIEAYINSYNGRVVTVGVRGQIIGGIPLAEGGVFTAATPATVGEAGIEAVLPLTNRDRMKQLLSDPRVNAPVMEALGQSARLNAQTVPAPHRMSYGGSSGVQTGTGSTVNQSTTIMVPDPQGVEAAVRRSNREAMFLAGVY